MSPNEPQRISNEDRRKFLVTLGLGGAISVSGCISLSDLRDETDDGEGGNGNQNGEGGNGGDELAEVGQAIRENLTGELDGRMLGTQQQEFASETREMADAVDAGLPTEEPRSDFENVAAAGWPVYEHLLDVGFFESTTEHLPEFTREYLETSVEAFINSEQLAEPLAEMGFSDEVAADLLVPVVNEAEDLSHYHWIATDEIPREEMVVGDAIPPMTQSAAGGTLLWLDDLDHHLWQKEVILTDEILSTATWDAQAMAAGYQLMTEGARQIAEDSGALSDDELAAMLSVGFAVQTIAQAFLPLDAYWVTEEMRAPFEEMRAPASD